MLNQKEFSRTQILNAPMNMVWEIIAKGDGVNDWLPVITSCRLEGEGDQMKRFCETADGKSLKETIDNIDHENHIFQYSIYEQNMLPVENYKGKMQVKSVEDGKTSITWTSVFEINEDHYPVVAESLEGLFKMAFDGIEKLANQTVA